MMIDKVNNINNIPDTKKTKSVSSAKDINKNDTIQISSEAQQAAELSKLAGLVKESSDIRVDRVQEIKAKIADGSYNFDDDKILSMVADKIADSLLRR